MLKTNHRALVNTMVPGNINENMGLVKTCFTGPKTIATNGQGDMKEYMNILKHGCAPLEHQEILGMPTMHYKPHCPGF